MSTETLWILHFIHCAHVRVHPRTATPQVSIEAPQKMQVEDPYDHVSGIYERNLSQCTKACVHMDACPVWDSQMNESIADE